jgi:hypothetical protein
MNHFYTIFVLQYDEDDGLLNWSEIPINTGITWNIIRERIDINWYFPSLSNNPNITWEIIQANPDMEWDYYYLSCNPNITWDIIQSNTDKEWCLKRFSENPNVTWDIVKNNPRVCWNYYELSRNIGIKLEDMKNNPDRNWRYDMRSLCPDVTWDTVLENPDIEWNMSNMTTNPNITIEFILANPQYKWKIEMDILYNVNTTDYIVLSGRYGEEIVNKIKNELDGWPYPFSVELSNYTWKDILNNVPYRIDHGCTSVVFNRWNASAKIQHVFKRWKHKLKYVSLTQILCRELDEKIPPELCVEIVSYTI